MTLSAAAVESELGAFADALLDVAEHALAMLRANHRAHRHARLEAVADLQRPGRFNQQLAGRLVRLADRQQHAARQTALAGTPVERLGDHRHAAREIRVRHDDDEVLRAAQRLHAFAGLRAALIDEPRHRRGSDERDRANPRMVAEGFDDFLAAVDEVDDARRQVALLEQLEDALLREWHLLGRLEDEGVAARHGEGQEPQRHHRGEVERRNRGAHADGLPHRDAVDAVGDVLESVSHEHRRRAAGDLDALDAATQAAARLVERLAVFGGDDPRDLLEVVLEQLPQLEHRIARA